MKRTYSVGIDIASATFVACILQGVDHLIAAPTTFGNTTSGYDEFEGWLAKHKVSPSTAVVCMEATGVYGEELAYHLTAGQWWLAVAPPLDVRRAFPAVGHKTDSVDSRQIAEYAARFHDKLHRFVPQADLLEQIKVLLQLREQYVRQKTAHLNARRALERKVVRTQLAERLHQQSIEQLKAHIKTIEKEIQQLFNQDPDLRSQIALLLTIPGVGLLLAGHIVILTAYMRDPLNPRAVAAHVGICPYQHTSGTSVYCRPRSRRFGPSAMRKLLHLAARSRRIHHQPSRHYFERKKAAGKPTQVILNNLANRLIRVMCAVLRTRQSYLDDYVSSPPKSLIPT